VSHARRRLVAATAAALALAVTGATACAQPPDTPQSAVAALRAGKYEEAVPALQHLADAPDATPATRRAYLRALGELSRLADAEAAAHRYTAAGGAGAAELQTVLGETLERRGKLAEARQAYERALAAHASDSLTARLRLALLRDETGDRAGARPLLEQVANAAGRGGTLSAEQLVAVGLAQRALGRDDPQRFRSALRAFDAAAAVDRADPTPRLLAGELFLDKYNGEDAQKSFAEVLQANPRHPRALVGMARVQQFNGSAGGGRLVDSALAVAPNDVDARLMRAATLLDAEDYAGAAGEVRLALAADSTSPDALTMLAAVRYVSGDRAGAEEARRRVLARAPKYAELYATLADLSARHRLYADAARFAAEGVALDPSSWRSHALRGINQLRLGHADSARASLETAFKGDPFDVWTKNTLDLLDATQGYRTERSARFAFIADSTESALLALYLGDLLEGAFDQLKARYGYTPPTPIRLEIYRRHADFSVRTVGLAGLGALGVSFGPVLAMDAPSARPVGEFHWGSTAWHELAHTFTLGVTENRVPRWLSEGLSVLEERRARPGWGDGPTPQFLGAYKAGKVPPPSRLNDGFMRPAYPEQVVFSYYAASLVAELIARDFGPGAIPKLLAGYKDGLSTEAAVKRAIGLDLAALDRRFDAYVRQRFGPALDAATTADGEYARQLASAEALVKAGKPDDAIPLLERAKATFPDFAQGDGPYWQLAKIYEAKGDPKRAAAELTELTKRSADNVAAQLELANLREQLGDSAGAAAALEEAIYVSPYEPAVHVRLATLAARLGDKKRAVRERRAVVALAPVDMADARYQLALALYQAGDAASARREVLRALEQAPSFGPAQELLLKLQEAR
jgi:tetratricopeptide (TPR) repeat protein